MTDVGWAYIYICFFNWIENWDKHFIWAYMFEWTASPKVISFQATSLSFITIRPAIRAIISTPGSPFPFSMSACVVAVYFRGQSHTVCAVQCLRVHCQCWVSIIDCISWIPCYAWINPCLSDVTIEQSNDNDEDNPVGGHVLRLKRRLKDYRMHFKKR